MGDRTCKVTNPDCGEPYVVKGYCWTHYMRVRAHGDPHVVKPKNWVKVDVEERFWSKVDKNGPLVPGHPEMGPCWIWTGGIVRGYGTFSERLEEGVRSFNAHRWIAQRHLGPIPTEVHVDHQCHNLDTSCAGGPTCLHRRCVNYEQHFRLTSLEVNVRAGRSGQYNAIKTHCKNNHELSGYNLIITKNGRTCRICSNAAGREYRARKRAEAKAALQAGG